ncbi:MAG: hypothetical protein CSA03_00655 [Bacteroidetes bacterium]|nr:MAG: hypothetical protein CSA03_00655 [Bacteroidota bacterium]
MKSGMFLHPLFMRSILLISFFYCFQVLGQDTTAVKSDSIPILNLVSVDVIMPPRLRRVLPRNSIIGKQQIDEIQANDVGEILQKVQGVNLKSYGGLGGLKTISVRSLGSQHSAISIDGFSIQNSQTGQVNLAQIQTNNLQSISIGVGEYAGYLIPVSSQIAGNNVSLQTFEMTFPNYDDTLQIRSNVRYGSFGQVSGYASAKVKIKNGFVSGFGNYRTSNGLYPFDIQNGSQNYTGVRSNNDYQDQYFGGVWGYRFGRDAMMRISYKQSSIDQGLPGAIILYNHHADERLSTNDNLLNADFRFRITEGIHARAYANGNVNSMRYLDPTYFNSAGFVDVTYDNRNANVGIVADGHMVQNGAHNYKRAMYFGVEGGVSDLSSSDSLFSSPIRKQVSAILGARLMFKWMRFRGHLSTQYVNESNRTSDDGKDVFGLNPYVSLESKEIGKKSIRHRIWYRNSLRVPSFNELYYNNIGNNELNPEKANQFGYDINLIPFQKQQHEVYVKLGTYFNRVTDKIVAIPTQNLFTWSIQNVGIVHAYGAEISVGTHIVFGKEDRWKLDGLGNYSFQRSMNMTDPNHSSYRHQIAYIPMHTGNFDLSLSYKKLGLKTTNYLVSKRYSLNENTTSNEVAGFVVTDFSVFYSFERWKKQSIRFQFQVKNAFNKSYSYIRSFIMPGRNYLISIQYALN